MLLTGTWQEFVEGDKIEWNPNTQDITVTTDSRAGSGDQVVVRLYDNDGNGAGIVSIYFNEQIMYDLRGCTDTKPFPATVDSQTDKTWTITYNIAERRVVLFCNEIKVVSVVISDRECTITKSVWRVDWERKPTQIQFDSISETAFASYCLSVKGKYIEGFWEM